MAPLASLTGNGEIVSVATAHLDRFDTVLRFKNTVQRENHLALTVDGTAQPSLICSANQLPELVVGRLFTNHLIESVDDIESLAIDEEALETRVAIRPHGGDASVVPGLRPLASPKPWNPERIFSLAEEFEADRTSHRRTRGVHSAYLAFLDQGEGELPAEAAGAGTEAGEPPAAEASGALADTATGASGAPAAGAGAGMLVCCEDIGRHNAFDKAIGWALMHRIDLGQCMLFTSGRVPQEIAEKAIRARIPVLISKAAVTDRAIETAVAFRLTLIALASSRSLDIMNDAAGVLERG